MNNNRNALKWLLEDLQTIQKDIDLKYEATSVLEAQKQSCIDEIRELLEIDNGSKNMDKLEEILDMDTCIYDKLDRICAI